MREDMSRMIRIGRAARLKPDGLEGYQRLHTAIWPQIKEVLKKAGIRNYSIFCADGLLFSYYEVEERNLGQIEKMWAENQICAEWEAEADRFREPWNPQTSQDIWKDMEPVFYLE